MTLTEHAIRRASARHDVLQSEEIIRARYARSPRSRRDWVLYTHEIETLRRIARGESLI